ncbi:MAG: FAD-dependent urate hydroxylase [Alteromonadaceae bacterium]|jgi:FAD-dependent urate hydroxylase
MKVAILGAGVGGLSTAIALKQAGFDVDVYERQPVTTEIGAGIVCWPNATFVLEQLGVLAQVITVSGALNKMNRFSSSGEALGSLDINMLSGLMGYPSLAIIRNDLMRILTHRFMTLNGTIHYNHNVFTLSDKNDKQASVVFDNGKRITADVIIGADGRMNSMARQYVNLDNKPIYQGFINWVGVFESVDDLFTDLAVADYWGVGERFGIVPVSTKKAYWAGGVSAKAIGERKPEHYKKDLQARFNDWPKPIRQIIEKTPLSAINKIYVHDHDPISSWHKNNVLLLGDAAHSPLPTSGQGACQALEDAWHISQCLKKKGSIADAFKHFTQLRMAKTTGITMGGRQLAKSIFNDDKNDCLQRNIASKNTDYKAVVTGMAKGWCSGLPIGH